MIKADKNKVSLQGDKDVIAAELAYIIKAIGDTAGKEVVRKATKILEALLEENAKVSKVHKENDKELEEKGSAETAREKIINNFTFQVLKGGKIV